MRCDIYKYSIHGSDGPQNYQQEANYAHIRYYNHIRWMGINCKNTSDEAPSCQLESNYTLSMTM